jgi:hypothetical protein
MDSARHVIKRISNPRYLRHMAALPWRAQSISHYLGRLPLAGLEPAVDHVHLRVCFLEQVVGLLVVDLHHGHLHVVHVRPVVVAQVEIESKVSMWLLTF